MLKFKNIKSGNIVEVTEQIAEQLLRPQGKYVEIFPEEEKKVTPKITKNESKTQDAPKRKKSKKKSTSTKGTK